MSQDARPGGQRLRAEGRPAPSAGARPLFTLCPTVWGEIRGPASPRPVPLAVRMVSSGQRAHSLTASSLTGPPTQGEVGCGVSRSSGLPATSRPRSRSAWSFHAHPPASPSASCFPVSCPGRSAGCSGEPSGDAAGGDPDVSPGRDPPLVCGVLGAGVGGAGCAPALSGGLGAAERRAAGCCTPGGPESERGVSRAAPRAAGAWTPGVWVHSFPRSVLQKTTLNLFVFVSTKSFTFLCQSDEVACG